MAFSLPVTNNSDISLEMAVWLLYDEYDFIREQNYVSATGLLKPLRHILLPRRMEEEQKVTSDVEDFISTAMGSALHAGIEKAWLNPVHVKKALHRLGYPAEAIERVVVNPTPEQLKETSIPVYVEQRTIKDVVVDGTTFKVGGKYDMICDGRITDTKSGSVWSWIFGGRDSDHQLQGSIYRWLNPDKIKEDFIRINMIFTDWSKADAATRKDYPPRRVMHKDIPLLSIEDTEKWVINKLRLILKYQNVEESKLPECTNEELWIGPPKYKYYADPAKAMGGAARSTRNFDTLPEAEEFKLSKGKGAIISVLGSPKRCGYCAAFPICTQKDKYTHD